MTIFHMRDIISGARLLIMSKNIHHINVPSFPGLSQADMLDWAKKYPKVAQALPKEPGEVENLHRGYIANVIYTLVGDNFKDWVDKKLKERTKKIAEERDLNIKMDS